MTMDCSIANSQVNHWQDSFQYLKWISTTTKSRLLQVSMSSRKDSRSSLKKSTNVLFLDGTWSVYSGQVDTRNQRQCSCFQAGKLQVFEHLLCICVLIWIDDFLVYIRSFEDLLIRVGLFQRFRKCNVMINPQKTFQREWSPGLV